MSEILIISDIHFGPTRGTKLGLEAERLFSQFVQSAASEPDTLVVDLGDRISDVDRETDLILAKQVAQWFTKLPNLRRHLLGNHDLQELSQADNEAIFQTSFDSRSLDYSGFHLIFWNSVPKLDQVQGFSLNPLHLEWLREDLDSTTLPCIVFTHLPLDNGSMKGNFYFEKAFPHHAYYPEHEGEKIREVLERSGKVQLCINGHAHWNAYHCIDSIHYITIPSLTEMFPTYPLACESWAKLSLSRDIHLQVFGNLPIEYRLPFRGLNSGHWLNIDKAYAPQVERPQ